MVYSAALSAGVQKTNWRALHSRWNSLVSSTLMIPFVGASPCHMSSVRKDLMRCRITSKTDNPEHSFSRDNSTCSCAIIPCCLVPCLYIIGKMWHGRYVCSICFISFFTSLSFSSFFLSVNRVDQNTCLSLLANLGYAAMGWTAISCSQKCCPRVNLTFRRHEGFWHDVLKECRMFQFIDFILRLQSHCQICSTLDCPGKAGDARDHCSCVPIQRFTSACVRLRQNMMAFPISRRLWKTLGFRSL